MLSGTYDDTAILWRVATHEKVGDWTAQDFLSDVAFSADGTRFATIGVNARVFSVTGGGGSRGFGTFQLGGGEAVAFTPDGSKVVTVGNGDVGVWDATSYKMLGTMSVPGNTVAGMLSPDGKLVATGGYDDMIRIWDVETHQPVGDPIKGHTDDVTSLAFSPDGTLLASGGADFKVRVHRVDTRKAVGDPLGGFDHQIVALAFSADGSRLAGGDVESVRVWKVADIT